MNLLLSLVLCLITRSSRKYKCGQRIFTDDSANDIGPRYDRYYLYQQKFCRYEIKTRGAGYHTILEWNEFDVDDNMPECSESSVFT